MGGAFEPGYRSHNRHFVAVAGGGALLLLAAAYFGVSTFSRAFGSGETALKQQPQQPAER